MSEKSVLITGANGFVGHHLARELHEHGYTVTGVGSSPDEQNSSLDHYIQADLTRPEEVDAIDFSTINSVIHLAALAAVGPSFDQPLHYLQTNAGMQVNLFEASRRQQKTPRFLIISSGALYGKQSQLPITESAPATPSSPYAISKLAQEQFADYYAGRGFDCIIARPFNHIGPGQGTGFIAPDLASQIIAAKQTGSTSIMAGNLDSQRDYTDVRDIARAYRLLIEHGQSGKLYNVCSGAPLSGRQILEGLLEAAGVTLDITQDESRMRPTDTPIIYGSHERLRQDTGWEPRIPIAETLRDVIVDWDGRQPAN